MSKDLSFKLSLDEIAKEGIKLLSEEEKFSFHVAEDPKFHKGRFKDNLSTDHAIEIYKSIEWPYNVWLFKYSSRRFCSYFFVQVIVVYF